MRVPPRALRRVLVVRVPVSMVVVMIVRGRGLAVDGDVVRVEGALGVVAEVAGDTVRSQYKQRNVILSLIAMKVVIIDRLHTLQCKVLKRRGEADETA